MSEMSNWYCKLLRRQSSPALPVVTGEEPRLQRLPHLKALLFDVYGTLFVSASGDVGTLRAAARGEAFDQALKACGAQSTGAAESGIEALLETIHEHHAQANERGVSYPEVDIVQVWQQTLEKLAIAIPADTKRKDVQHFLERLALEYEVRVNPVWPMPDLEAMLDQLRDTPLALGIISNAQFFTPMLFEAFLGRSANDCGFAGDLQFYSYRFGEAKPGAGLYRRARQALAQRGITAEEVLYVGNDLLNDVVPAVDVGFRTALFAGDARSLRRRENDERCRGVQPDLVLTALSQVLDCLPRSATGTGC